MVDRNFFVSKTFSKDNLKFALLLLTEPSWRKNEAEALASQVNFCNVSYVALERWTSYSSLLSSRKKKCVLEMEPFQTILS